MAPLLSIPLLRTQSDRRLAALAAEGHDRAFEAIVERYRRPLQRYLRRLLSEALAEDVLQASFVRAWQALRAGTDVRDLRPWLYRIAHNQALNTLRAAGSALPAVTADLPATSLETEVERREELRAALHGIEALPDRQRAALIAIAVADRPHADVARELGMSDGALRQLLLRARTTLRAAATALTPYPLMSWLAGGQEATAARVAEVGVGAGGAGVAFKASAAVLAAGAVVAGGPALRGDDRPASAKRAPVAEQAHRKAAPRTAVVVSAPVPTADHEAGGQGRPLDDHGGQVQRSSSGEHSGSGHGKRSSSHGSGSSGAGSSDESGSGKSGSGESDSDEDSGKSGSSGKGSGKSGDSGDDSRHSGSGDDSSEGGGSAKSDSGRSGGSGESGSGKSGSGESDSGERSGDADETRAVPPVPGADEAVPTTAPSTSGSGDGSGSGSSGSGDSGGSGSGDDGSGGD
jgi:RNA polymerase sigma factor (sigma-70 family)